MEWSEEVNDEGKERKSFGVRLEGGGGNKSPTFQEGLIIAILPRKRSGNDFSFTPLKEPPRDVIKEK